MKLQHLPHRNQVYQSAGSLISGTLVNLVSVWEVRQFHQKTMLPCRVFPALCHLASAKAHIGSAIFCRFLKEKGTIVFASHERQTYAMICLSRITQSRRGFQDVAPLSYNTNAPRAEFSKQELKFEDVVWKSSPPQNGCFEPVLKSLKHIWGNWSYPRAST